jgi:hypothetical protein
MKWSEEVAGRSGRKKWQPHLLAGRRLGRGGSAAVRVIGRAFVEAAAVGAWVAACRAAGAGAGRWWGGASAADTGR